MAGVDNAHHELSEEESRSDGNIHITCLSSIIMTSPHILPRSVLLLI